MLQTKPVFTPSLDSARSFMDEHCIEAIKIFNTGGEFEGVRGFGFVSQAEELCDLTNYPCGLDELLVEQSELGEVLVDRNGNILESSDIVLEQMKIVAGFIECVIKPVELAIRQAYAEGKSISDKRFRILGAT